MAEAEGQVYEDDEELDPEREARRRLALAQIRQYPDAALRMERGRWSEFDDELRRLVERMKRLMEDAHGIGLAATQVGVLRRLFVFQPARTRSPSSSTRSRRARARRPTSPTRAASRIQGVLVPVERAVRVTLAGRDENGDEVRYELEDIYARAAQHETDHLDGVLILDRTTTEARREALATLRPRDRPRADMARSRSPRPRRSAPTCSSGSPRRTRSRCCSRDPTRRAAAAASRRRRRRRRSAERLGIPVRSPSGSTGVELPAGHRRRRRIRAAHPGAAARRARCGSTSTRRCCRAGAAPRRSSGRSWPATRAPASRSTARRRSSTPGRSRAQEAFDVAPEDDAGAVYARAAEVAARLLDGVLAGEPLRAAAGGGRDVRGEDRARRSRARPRAARPRARAPRARAVAAHRRARVVDGRRSWSGTRASPTTARSSCSRSSRRAAGGWRTPPTSAGSADGGLARAPAAYEVLLRVFEQDAYADRAFRTAAPRPRRPRARVRAAARLRRRAARAHARPRDRDARQRPVRKLDPPVRAALRLGAYQLGYTETAPHAAANESVELVRACAARAGGPVHERRHAPARRRHAAAARTRCPTAR